MRRWRPGHGARRALRGLQGPPPGPAGGDLTGNYPNPALADGAIDSVDLFTASLTDGPAGTPTLRSLGSGAQQAVAGNDDRLLFLPGSGNVGIGPGTLNGTVAGANNIAAGSGALNSLTTGINNLGVGQNALNSLTIGGNNLGAGGGALASTTLGSSNVALGPFSLTSNTTGQGNVAGGIGSLLSLTTGTSNVGVGTNALPGMTTGNDNIALGEAAGAAFAGGDSGNIALGAPGVSGNDGTFIDGIFGTAVDPSGIAAVVDANGQLGTVVSSRRAKREIEGLEGTQATRALALLRPVSFRYRASHAPRDSSIHYGLIAEQVERVLPELVVKQGGEPATVAYHELPPLLLAEIQRQRELLRDQHGRLHRLSARVSRLERGR